MYEHLRLVERMVVWCSWKRCPKLMLCSATADLSGWSRRICRWCSFNLKSIAICSSETSVHFQRTTRCYIPEDSILHNHQSENLKSYKSTVIHQHLRGSRL
jgi:hypothetical protein